jgi:hypothetical protein
MTTPHDDGLRINETYVDRKGGRWVVRAFLHDEGRWFVDDPNGTHVHVMTIASPGVKARGRFVKRSTFVKSLAPLA